MEKQYLIVQEEVNTFKRGNNANNFGENIEEEYKSSKRFINE